MLRIIVELLLLAMLAHLIGIARGPRLARYYNITATTLVLVAVFELFVPWLRH